MGKCTKVRRPPKEAFQQLFYYLDKPSFVNIRGMSIKETTKSYLQETKGDLDLIQFYLQ